MKLSKKIFTSMAFIFCFAVTGCSANESGTNYGTVKDFTLKNTKGESVQLSEVLKTHKAVLLNFWATWCPPCREEIPGLMDIQKNHGGEAFTILGVDIGESDVKVSSFMDKIGINYPVLLDSTQSVAESYRVVGIPTSYLIASDGKILGEYHAYTPKLVADIERAIA